MLMASGVISLSTSKLDIRLSQSSGNLSHRSRLECPKPSLPDLLKSEGVDKPDYSSGYVQRVRQKYLALIAANSVDTSPTKGSLNLSPSKGPSVLTSPHKQVSACKAKQEHVESEPKFLRRTKLQHLDEAEFSNEKFHSALAKHPFLKTNSKLEDENENECIGSRSQLVSSLRAVFDKHSQPHVSQAFSTSQENGLSVSRSPQKHVYATEPRHRSSENIAVSPKVFIDSASKAISTAIKPNSITPCDEHNGTETQKQPFYGERVVIFRGRFFQRSRHGNETKISENSKADTVVLRNIATNIESEIVSSKAEPAASISELNGNGISSKENGDVNLLDENGADDSNDDQSLSSFTYTIIGASAKISVKPMWLRRDKASSSKDATVSIRKVLRFDDKVDVFGYEQYCYSTGDETTEDADDSSNCKNNKRSFPLVERDWSLLNMTVGKNCRGNFESETTSLGMKPLTCPISSPSISCDDINGNHAVDEKTNNNNNSNGQQESRLFGVNSTADAMDLVF